MNSIWMWWIYRKWINEIKLKWITFMCRTIITSVVLKSLESCGHESSGIGNEYAGLVLKDKTVNRPRSRHIICHNFSNWNIFTKCNQTKNLKSPLESQTDKYRKILKDTWQKTERETESFSIDGWLNV